MLYAVFLLDLQNAQEKAIPQRNVPQRVEEIFIGFIRLLPLHFAEHHNIAFYASQLNISVVYLSRVVRRVAGRTVVDYINQMLLMEASFLLRTSKRSISQIADQLHFADTPSFSKFFSRMKGMSPREYRETKGSNKRTQATTKQLMDTKLIIFDFDGTLGNTRRTIVTTMQMTIAELGLPRRNDQACASTIGLPLADCFKTLFPQLNDERITLCASTYRRLFEENRLTIKPQAFPHVQQTLSALKKQGFILTIASSRSHASLTELIHDLNIADYISLLIGADDVEQAKPNPEPVLKTLAATGIEASQTLVVGDMNVDILMGANAGAKTCGVTYGNGTREELAKAGAEHIIDSIDQLIPLLTV
jgi:phosphoglycolate phosphatase